MMIDPATDWFEIVKIPTFDLEEVTIVNDEYIDKSYARVSQIINNIWIFRYLRPCKVVFDNGSGFKRDFTPLLNYFDIKPVLTSVNNSQANDPFERVDQVIINMSVNKDLDNKVLDYIYIYGVKT